MEETLRVKSIVLEAWQALKKQLKFWVVFALVLFVGNMILGGVQEWLGNQGWGMLQTVWSLLLRLVQLYVGLVVIIISLKSIRGEQIEKSDFLVSDTSLLWRFFLISIIYGLIVGVGTVLFIVPGIILGLIYGQVTFLTVDQAMEVKAALAESKRLTAGKKWQIFLISLVGVGINVVGMLCVGIGLLVTLPLSLLISAVVYKRLSGEKSSAGNTSSVTIPAEPITPVEETMPVSPVKSNAEINQYQI